MPKERILRKKIEQLNELKLELVSRSEKSKEEVVENIKDTVEELELILEDFNYISKEDCTKAKLDIDTKDVRALPEFNLSNLKQYSGQNGTLPYVAINDEVYDVSNTEYWKKKEEYNAVAGQSVTRTYENYKAKQNDIFQGAKLVGTLTSE